MRATLIAAGTAVVLWALRIKAPALRHAAWTAVVLAMLLLPLWSLAGLKLAVPVLPATVEAPAAAPSAVTTTPVVESPMTVTPSLSTSVAQTESSRQINWQVVLLAVYLSGVIVLLVRLGIGTVQAQRLRRNAVTEGGRAASDFCTTPITVGFLRPTLILPASWPQWSSAQLQAVLTHEDEHARRRDPLVQWLALCNRAVFWFHPLAWWLERRLATLAEESCDAAVLAAGNSPQDYSEYLLEMARQVTHQGRRVRTVGMAMPGSGLKPRLKQILEGVPAAPVSRARVACTIAFCALSSMLLAAGTLAERQSGTQDPAAGGPEKFDVVSIKPCASVQAAETGRGAGPNLAQVSPGRAYWACVTLAALIDQAYAGADFPLLNVAARPLAFEGRRGATETSTRVRGGPAWISADRFAIEVTAPAETINGRGNLIRLPGAMNRALRAMLADRFQLKVRRATEERPMYALTVAPGGLKIKPPAAGDCTVWTTGMPRSPERGEKPYCGNVAHTAPLAQQARMAAGDDVGAIAAMPGVNRRLEYSGVTLAAAAEDLATVMDRFVLDKTGVTGEFMFAVEFSADDSTPGFGGGSSDASGPRIFQALEALGLKLEPTKGSAEFLQIDSVQRPRPDAPLEIAEPPARASGPYVAAESDQTQLADQKFAVASIKPCQGGGAANGPVLAGGIGASGSSGVSLNSITVRCQTVIDMIARSYMMFGNPPPLNALNRFDPEKISGGPDWARSDRYEIEARADGTPGPAVMMGPMLRALLEERFQLKLHQELKDVSALALTVATTGLKLKPVDPSSCIADSVVVAGSSPSAGDKPRCNSSLVFNGPNRTFKSTGQTFERVSQHLGPMLFGRVVVDQTSTAGLFTFSVEFAPDDSTPALNPISADAPNAALAPSIFTAFEKLGLKFVATKVPQGHLVVDRLSRPSPDSPARPLVLR